MISYEDLHTPIVDSQNFSDATSPARFAPIMTLTGIFSIS